MRILFVGRFEADYNRTLVLLNGLTDLGVAVRMLQIPRHGNSEAREVAAAAAEADVVLVPNFAHRDVPFVRRHCGARPLVFDPLVSKWQTLVEDYGSVSRYSFSAVRCWWRDRSAMRAADLVVADTAAHAAYYQQCYGLSAQRLCVVPVGADEQLFASSGPRPARLDGSLDLFFYGSFAPLHGVPVVIAAMRLLAGENHRLRIVGGGRKIGSGFTEPEVRADLERAPVPGVEWVPRVPYEQLPDEISAADVCLGIFGEGRKAQLVVPNKLYHYAACGKCTITLDTPALREVFTPSVDVIEVSPGAPALAAAIRAVAADPAWRNAVGAAARQRLVRNCGRTGVAATLLRHMRDRLGIAVPSLPDEALVS